MCLSLSVGSLFSLSAHFFRVENSGLLEALRILQGSQADSKSRPIEKEIEDCWLQKSESII